MAGRARTKALTEELEKRAREASDLDGELPWSTLDYVADWIESGNTVKELAAELSTDLGDEVTYARVMAVLRAAHGENATDERLSASRTRASHSLAETAVELVDAPAETNVEVSRARERARTRQWMAERYNPAAFGQTKHVSVGGSIGLLHLDALRMFPPKVTGSVQDAQISTTAQPALPPASSTSDDAA